MAKIAQIQPTGNYNSQNGLMYTFEITLDDGQTGQVSAKSQDRWKVGDEVEAEVTQSQWGPKMKLSKAGYGGSPGSNRGSGNWSPEKELRISFLSALGSAATFYSQREATPEQVAATALEWANAAMEIGKEKVQDPSPVQNVAPKTNLPF